MIIGLSGTKKTIATRLLCEKYAFIEMSFRKPIKQGFIDIFGLTQNQVFVHTDVVDSFWQTTPFHLFRAFETEFLQKQLPLVVPSIDNFYIKRMEKNLSYYTHKNIVISDCSNIEELLFIKRLHGCIIQITNKDSCSDISDYNIYETESEYELENSIRHIMNNIYTNPL